MKFSVVEDQTMFRQLLESVLAQQGVGTVECSYANAASARAGLQDIAKTRILLMDIRLPDGDGIALADEFFEHLPKTRTILVSSSVEDYIVHRVSKANVAGFIHKDDETSTLIAGIKAVDAGGCYYSPIYSKAKETLLKGSDFRSFLSNHEQTLLELLGAGLTDQQVADFIGRSPATVATHRRNIMSKLNLHTAQQLQTYAITRGFVSPALLGKAGQR